MEQFNDTKKLLLISGISKCPFQVYNNNRSCLYLVYCIRILLKKLIKYENFVDVLNLGNLYSFLSYLKKKLIFLN